MEGNVSLHVLAFLSHGDVTDIVIITTVKILWHQSSAIPIPAPLQEDIAACMCPFVVALLLFRHL